jgi:hypothetical protein
VQNNLTGHVEECRPYYEDAALNWLAVQGLNAKGRSAPSEEVKVVAARGAWLFDSTPRTAAREQPPAVVGLQLLNLSCVNCSGCKPFWV